MSTKTDSVAARSSYERKTSVIALASDQAGRRTPPCANLATVDVVADGSLAVTRPAIPRLFRFLLLLTGVKV
jgi:hypothetical protein